jgi:hypothetical protein
MQRREFITALGRAAAGPMVARAQRAVPVIEFFHVASPNGYAATSITFRANPSDHPRAEKMSRNVLTAAVPLEPRLHVPRARNDARREPRVLS